MLRPADTCAGALAEHEAVAAASITPRLTQEEAEQLPQNAHIGPGLPLCPMLFMALLLLLLLLLTLLLLQLVHTFCVQ
jgi:hypothetical protein